ncbi:Gfo/Idh/MocA family protein [Virgibacillus halodenitrificans]|uniref:Gfo/Idh/MocA family protein n=1 Tax=Virgibacillus halodenitrificans TaxID=1482 RepID=UPI0002E66A5D|nr:Gfo/Idh/MocA family oxidoreductase [Virgibacillus halodenitrificans]
MINILVLGAGTMGRTHIRAYQRMSNVKVVGIVDVNKPTVEGVAKELYFNRFEDALESLGEIHVVDICLPTYLHKEFAIKAATSKAHIICEKPLASTLEDAREIISICEENKVKLFVGHVVRFFSEYSQAKKLVDQNLFGDIKYVRTFRNSSFPLAWNDWYSNYQYSGGLLLDLLIHDIDFLCWCFGEVESVNANNIRKMEYKDVKHISVDLNFKNGVNAQVAGSWSENKFRTNFEIQGEAGYLVFDSTKEQPLNLQVKRETSMKLIANQGEIKNTESPYFTQLNHYVDCIINNHTPIMTPQEAYQSMKIAFAAIKSFEIGDSVYLEEKYY